MKMPKNDPEIKRNSFLNKGILFLLFCGCAVRVPSPVEDIEHSASAWIDGRYVKVTICAEKLSDEDKERLKKYYKKVFPANGIFVKWDFNFKDCKNTQKKKMHNM
jgi:hypothetical protein